MLLELPGLTALAALSRPFLAALSGLLALLTWLLLSNSVAWRRVDKKISRSFANRFVLAALHAWGEVISNGGCDVSTPRGAAACRCRRGKRTQKIGQGGIRAAMYRVQLAAAVNA